MCRCGGVRKASEHHSSIPHCTFAYRILLTYNDCCDKSALVLSVGLYLRADIDIAQHTKHFFLYALLIQE